MPLTRVPLHTPRPAIVLPPVDAHDRAAGGLDRPTAFASWTWRDAVWVLGFSLVVWALFIAIFVSGIRLITWLEGL